MKNSVMLTITSLLLVLFLTFHLADDIRHGFEPGGLSNLVGGVLITVVWLFGTLVLFERRSGYIIMLLGSLFSLVVPYVHMKGEGCRRHQQNRQFQRTLLFRLDADRDRRARALLRHPRGARTVEPAMAPVPIVQQQRGSAA